ncbi:AGE family epimerase/isomerase [Tenacibaculum agarivorans]|uniref:AGE family epimerase/isomerase n=1 Tax=Tenacibaculum agarivorans TaxID=1908389 RepID=UPI00094BA565|nr:AGE family epimerase/isomerase [Tenacibaculum agarivorans]
MNILEHLKIDLENELKNILTYWEKHTVDDDFGGFIGHIDYPNIKNKQAHKGVILNTRILWSFSKASNYYKDDRYKDVSERSFTYLKEYFKDNKYGGVYWEVNYKGTPINTRKQIYAQAFAIYALSEYYLYSKNEEAKVWAKEIFKFIEENAFDNKYNGYIEAFEENWSAIEDMRLSEKDDNAAKTMNTHLHILEAYTNLYTIYPDDRLEKALQNLIAIFIDKFLSEDGHLHLFFNEQWELKSSVYSYGHDIEASWLLLEAARVIKATETIKELEEIAVKITDHFVKVAIAQDGGVMNEIDTATGQVDTDRHWWQQAEAMAGLYHTYKITEDSRYLDHLFKIWNFIKTSIIDHTYGEWYWLVDKNGHFNTAHEKVGMWKCPYHNTRACIEIIQ